MAKDIKPITEIKQTGKDFVVTSKTPGKTVTNSFTVGKEADITTMDGKKLKVRNSILLFALIAQMFYFVKTPHFVICASDDNNVNVCKFLLEPCDVYHLPLCFPPPSALSIWRVANWSAIPASSATSKSSREERWLRYSNCRQCDSFHTHVSKIKPISNLVTLECFTVVYHKLKQYEPPGHKCNVSFPLFRLCPWAQQLLSGRAKRCNLDSKETNVYLKNKSVT